MKHFDSLWIDGLTDGWKGVARDIYLVPPLPTLVPKEVLTSAELYSCRCSMGRSWSQDLSTHRSAPYRIYHPPNQPFHVVVVEVGWSHENGRDFWSRACEEEVSVPYLK